jgi:hypothetical protein
MQLYSVEKNISQAIPGHAAAFIDLHFPGLTSGPTTVICFASRTEAGGKVPSLSSNSDSISQIQTHKHINTLCLFDLYTLTTTSFPFSFFFGSC